MAENRNGKGKRERVEGAFPIKEANEDTKIKNTSPSSLPRFHGLTTKYPIFFNLSVFSYDEPMTIQMMSKS